MPDPVVIEQLVTYFTGSNVAAASIGLQMGGHALTMAQPYFAMRSALGIEGYADRDEARAAISTRLQHSARDGVIGELGELKKWLRRAGEILAPYSGDAPGTPTRDALVMINAALNPQARERVETALRNLKDSPDGR